MDIIGQRFAKLLVISYDVPVTYSYGTYRKVICKCDCGNSVSVYPSNLYKGSTKSCGCHKRESANKHCITHGMSKTTEYRIWTGIRKRCYTTTYKEYHLYGGRGILMSESWKNDFMSFLSDMGERPAGASIDRIDNNLGYSKENCRWATPSQQTRNRRMAVIVEYEGQSFFLADFCDKFSIPYITAYNWFIRKKYTPEQISYAMTKRQLKLGTL